MYFRKQNHTIDTNSIVNKSFILKYGFFNYMINDKIF